MSEVNPTAAVSDSEATSSATSTGAPTGAASGDFNASTTIGSMSELQTKAPTLYKAMMEGIATNICNEMKNHQDRLKEMQRQAARDAEGKS